MNNKFERPMMLYIFFYIYALGYYIYILHLSIFLHRVKQAIDVIVMYRAIYSTTRSWKYYNAHPLHYLIKISKYENMVRILEEYIIPLALRHTGKERAVLDIS